MQISSLISIIYTLLDSFAKESRSSSGVHLQVHVGAPLAVPDFLTFHDNTGPAQLCPSEALGYRTFIYSGSASAASYFVKDYEGSNSQLCISEKWEWSGVFGHNITLCAEDNTATAAFDVTDESNVQLVVDQDEYAAFIPSGSPSGICLPVFFASPQSLPVGAPFSLIYVSIDR